MRVLLTGAAGRLGQVVHQLMQTSGLSVRATDRRGGGEDDLMIQPADLLNYEACVGLVEGIDTVVHLANHANPDGLPPHRLYIENMTMNTNLLEAALAAGVQKVIFASSIHAFVGPRGQSQESLPSNLPYLPLDSHVPANPSNSYGLSKTATESMLLSMIRFRGLSSAIALRFPLLLKQAPVYTELVQPAWSYPRVRLDASFFFLTFMDAAQLILHCIHSPCPGYRCFFPAQSAPGRTPEFVRKVIRRYFPQVPLRRPLDQMDRLVDLSYITQETGWTPGESGVDPSPVPQTLRS